jgi:NAD(P)-dependent dehydrogenase (short-subunit alcohol dehydrogenase family)
MRIIVIGGTGTIGKAIVKELQQRHEVIVAGFSKGDAQVDIENRDSIEKLYKSIGKFDALVVAAGKVHFGDLAEMTYDNYFVGLNSKLMGQVNAVLIGSRYINDGGSFTLTSGILSDEPIRKGSSASMVNAGLHGFVKGAAIELPRGQRLNAVSPTVLAESMDSYAEFFRGFEPVSAARVALAYSKSVEGLQTGEIFRVG